MNHTQALTARLMNERERLANAKSHQERELRAVWVKQIEQELKAERAMFSGDQEVTDDELLESLLA